MVDDIGTISARLDAIHDRQLEQGKVLERFGTILDRIAGQSERLNNLQAMQNEMRGDFNSLETRILPIITHQASCPRDSVKELRAWFIAFAGTVITIMIYHILGGKP
jgi:hypothetical protein